MILLIEAQERQLALLDQLGLEPDMAAGHSFGEIMALHRAGVMDADMALTAAAERGALMARAAQRTKGAMLAVQAEAKTVAPILKSVGEGLVLANDNAPGQIVISGSTAAVERATELAKEAGAKRAVLLPVSAPFHCALMQPAADAMDEALGAARPGGGAAVP